MGMPVSSRSATDRQESRPVSRAKSPDSRTMVDSMDRSETVGIELTKPTTSLMAGLTTSGLLGVMVSRWRPRPERASGRGISDASAPTTRVGACSPSRCTHQSSVSRRYQTTERSRGMYPAFHHSPIHCPAAIRFPPTMTPPAVTDVNRPGVVDLSAVGVCDSELVLDHERPFR